MPKLNNTERRKAEAAPYTRPLPAAVRYTTGRALFSAYSPKRTTVGDGNGAMAGLSVKGIEKNRLPRVRDFDRHKVPQPIGEAAETAVGVNPPYPVDRQKTRSQSERPRNYDFLYVPLDDDGDSSKADISQTGHSKVSKAVEAKRRQVYINHWTELEANQEVLKEKQPPFTKFPYLLPAGERYSLRVHPNREEMVKLIGEVTEIRQQLGIANGLPVRPQPHGDGVFQPPPLVRSRTRTYFSIFDCPHPKLYEYLRRLSLSHAQTVIPPPQGQQGGSGTTSYN